VEINSLQLQNFRSYKKQEFKFASGTTLLVGPNASGKTNLLEAIYLLATGKSFRAGVEEEMISYGKEFARVKGVVAHFSARQEGRELKFTRTEGEDLEVLLTTGEVAGKKVAKKKYSINKVGKRRMDFVGRLRCVLFGPEDLEIIVDSPSTRRNYLDNVLEQVDRDYRRSSLSYQKGLRQRNKLLEQIREEGKPRSVLFFWDKLLIENGEVITQKREEFIDFINQQPDYFGDLNIVYDRSTISPQRLGKYAGEEVAAGMTLVGPHRDDFEVTMKKRSLHTFGSRGEQRTAVFSLKLGELEYVSQRTSDPSTGHSTLRDEPSSSDSKSSGQDRPVLLLDDIFSELDHERRKRLLEVIPKQQTIITTTDIHLVEPAYRKKVKKIELRA
jgi:DNA replication and repair protein RecF